jgi:NAD(P)H-hydrate epimerase
MGASEGWSPPAPPELPADGHKGLAGRVLVAAGSPWMPGAAVLAARAALRGGAGLVTIFCQDERMPLALCGAVPEAIHLAAGRGALRASEFHAALVGPGLGTGAAGRALLEEVLADFAGPLVVDADGLNLLAGSLVRLHARTAPVILTPHPGEGARLLGRAVGPGPDERAEAARALALQARAICCLKGRGTLVSDGERLHQNDTGTSAMATAGAGDVLGGLLAAYLARTVTLGGPRWTAFDAAARAVRVHGLAGELAEAELGSLAVTASDLVAHLPRAQSPGPTRELR